MIFSIFKERDSAFSFRNINCCENEQLLLLEQQKCCKTVLKKKFEAITTVSFVQDLYLDMENLNYMKILLFN